MLPGHTVMLPRHTQLFPVHTKLLPRHTQLLPRHTQQLPGHTKLLPRHRNCSPGMHYRSGTWASWGLGRAYWKLDWASWRPDWASWRLDWASRSGGGRKDWFFIGFSRFLGGWSHARLWTGHGRAGSFRPPKTHFQDKPLTTTTHHSEQRSAKNAVGDWN